MVCNGAHLRSIVAKAMLVICSKRVDRHQVKRWDKSSLFIVPLTAKAQGLRSEI
jgi:hypothetical protein